MAIAGLEAGAVRVCVTPGQVLGAALLFQGQTASAIGFQSELFSH